ncbi:MAG: DALR domain-containing protein, partial [Candidatus Sigynarchaeota archaeon]
FPHHENEIAQSEARSGKPFCKFWIHNGFVTVDKEKMSKSLGNFFTVEQVLSQYEAPAIRLFLLSAHYRNPIDYSRDLLDQAKKNWQKIRDTWTALLAALEPGTSAAHALPVVRTTLPPDIAAVLDEFDAAMDDDFNTPRALAALFTTIKWVNDALAKEKDANSLKAGFQVLATILGVLGFDEPYMARFLQAGARATRQIESLIQHFIDQRNAERKAKNFKKADEIRAMLKGMGIELVDSKDGTTWKLAT